MMFWARYFPYLVAVSALCICGLTLYNKGKSDGLAQARVECIQKTEESAQKSEKLYDKNIRDARQIKDRGAAVRELSNLGILRDTAG